MGGQQPRPAWPKRSPYTASASGHGDEKLSIYLDGSNTATQVVVGVYSNSVCQIIRRRSMAQATITNPVTSGWKHRGPFRRPWCGEAGTVYWIAVLGPSGGGNGAVSRRVDRREVRDQLAVESDDAASGPGATGQAVFSTRRCRPTAASS